MDDVVVIGIGLHPFGKFPDESLSDLARVAIWAAIGDSGIDPHLIDIAYVANCYSGFFTEQVDAVAPIVIGYSGLSGMAMIHISGGSGSGSVAFHDAALAVASGQYRMALAVGVEKLYVRGDPARSIAAIATSSEKAVATEMGLTMVGEMSMSTRGQMARFGWTQEDFALVAEKNRAHGALNPLAEVQQPISSEEILRSRVVAYPLTRPMCAGAAVDGAAAVIVCTAKTAARYAPGNHPKLAAFSLVGARYIPNGRVDDRPGMLSMDEAPRAFAQAFERAGLGPEDIELAQVHDSVAPEELLAYRVLGLCDAGDEPLLLRSGATRIGGHVPVNTDGGMLSRGHPIAASGVAQVCEATIQMRGRAGARQAYPRRSHPPRVAALQNAGAQGGPSKGTAVSAAFLMTM